MRCALETIGQYALLFGNLALSAWLTFGKSYAGKKGENLATKEDIGEITAVVKRIETDHQRELELLKSQQQLRLAAIERRLQAHQEAFAHWRSLVSLLHDGGLADKVKECDAWWSTNCLFLEDTARQAFSQAFWSASMYQQVSSRPARKEGDSQFLTDRLSTIWAAGDTILSAVQLPVLSDAERKVTQMPQII